MPVIKGLLSVCMLLISLSVKAAEFEVVDKLTVGGSALYKTSVTIITPDTLPSSLWISTSAASPQLYISTSGRTGIGLSSPLSMLDVAQGLAVGSYAGSNAAPANGAIISGSLGVGTPSPLSALDIVGGAAIGSYAGTNAAPANSLIVSGNLGVGTSAPTHKLHVAGNAIVTSSMSVSGSGLSGTTPAFQVIGGTLTVLANGNAGIGTALPLSRLDVAGGVAVGAYAGANAAPANGAIISGPVAIGASSLDGTAPEKLKVYAGATSSYNAISAYGTINSYLQLNIKNSSSGGSASSDIVATADNGSESTNYIDMGINSSGYNDSAFTIGGANDAYLYNVGQNLALGTATSAKAIKFHTGGTLAANERARIDGDGDMGVGQTNPTALVHIGAGTSNSGHLRMDGIAGNPGTPTDGDHWYNTTQKSHRFRETAGTVGLVGLLYANTSVSNSVTNTTTETNFNTSYALPANSLTAGKVIRVTAMGTIARASGNMTWRVKMGTTNLLATAAITPASGTYLWRVEAYITCITTGASGTVEAQGLLTRASSTTDSVPAQMLNTGTVTVDTTASQTLQLSAQWTATSTSNIIILRQIMIEAMD